MFSKIKRGATTATLLLFLASCAHLPLDKGYMGPKPLPQELKVKYLLDENLERKIEYKTTKKEIGKKVTRYEIEIPPKKGNSPVEIVYREQNKPGKHPTILIFPALAGNYLEARILSWYYTNNDMNTIIVYRPEKDVLTSAAEEGLEKLLEQTAINYLNIFDWASQQDKIDKGRIGAIGVSLGGITLSTIAGLKQETFDYPIYYFIALGGGPIADILKDSKESLVRKKWKKMKKVSNLDDEELYKLLKNTIKTDPMNFVNYADSENLMMVVTLFDRAVPTKYQKELWKAFGKPEVVFMPIGHYTAILFAPVMLPMSLDFFERKFSEDQTNKVELLEEKAIIFEKGIGGHITDDGFLAYRIKSKDFSNRIEARYGDTPSWTSEYLVAESLNYVMAKGDEKEQIKKRIKILTNSLHVLQKVTGIEGYVARAAVRGDKQPSEKNIWKRGEGNYKDYWWKGDTSKDQYAHLLFAYGTVYDLFDDEDTKAIIREDVEKIADHVLRNNLKIIGEQGRTKHGDLNKRGGGGWKVLLDSLHIPFKILPFDANPFFDLEIGLNAALSLNVFKTAYHITGKDRFRGAYKDLIRQDYHKAVGEGLYRAKGYPNYSNDVMSFITINQLLKYENNGAIRKYYEGGLEKNWMGVKNLDYAFFTFLYYANNKDKIHTDEAKIRLQNSSRKLLLMPQNAGSSFIWKSAPKNWFETGNESMYTRTDFLVAYRLGQYYGLIE